MKEINQAQAFLNTEPELIMNWKDVRKFVSYVLLAGNVKVTDDVYENLIGLNWANLRYHLNKNDIHKERISVTPFREVMSVLPRKYHEKLVS